MKIAKDKLFVLICLIISVIALAITSNIMSNRMANTAKDLGNETLMLEELDSNVYRISGSGLLNKSDMETLLSRKSLSKESVENLIITGSITELCYGVLSEFPNLYTLMIGDSVDTIRNGALHDCQMLEIVYFHNPHIKLGIDTLYNCGAPIVAINGYGSEIAKQIQNDNIYYIEQVDTYESLTSNIPSEPDCLLFTSDQLQATCQQENDGLITVQPEAIQYGPYTTIKRGKCSVVVRGDGFIELSTDCIDINTENTNNVHIQNIKISKDTITYDATFDRTCARVEFRVTNKTGKTITVNNIEVLSYRPDYSYLRNCWWPK